MEKQSAKEAWVRSAMEKTGMDRESALLMYHWVEDRHFRKSLKSAKAGDCDNYTAAVLEDGARLRLAVFRFRISRFFEGLYEDSWLEGAVLWLKVKWERFVTDPIFEWRMGRQRAQKGFCDRDCWDIDTWMTTVLPAAIEQMAGNLNGYPGCIEAIMRKESPYKFKGYGDDPDEKSMERYEWWRNHLLWIAKNLREANEETCSVKNKFPFHYRSRFVKCEDDPYYSMMVSDYTDSEKEDIRKYYARKMQIAEYRWSCFRNAMVELSYLHGCLWD